MGFSIIKEEFSDSWRKNLKPLIVEIDGFDFQPTRTYAVGRRLPDGTEVRVAMSQRGSSSQRIGLDQRAETVAQGGIMLFHDCTQNRNGTYEARRSVVISTGDDPEMVAHVLHGVWARVGAPIQREDGGWSQSVQYVDAGQAHLVDGYDDMVETVVRVLGEDGPGRASAVIRGLDPDGVALAATISRAFDWEKMAYLSPEESFDAFIDRESVHIDGISVSVSGADFLGIVRRFEDAKWEVIPMRTLSLGSKVAQEAAEGGRDTSRAYRVSSKFARRGFTPSIVAACHGKGWFAKDVVPLEGIPAPILLAHIPTENIRPDVDYTGREEPQALPQPSYLARGRRPEAVAAGTEESASSAPKKRRITRRRTEETPVEPPSRAFLDSVEGASVGAPTPAADPDADFEFADEDFAFLNGLRGGDEDPATAPRL